MATTVEEGKLYERASMILVPMDTKGVIFVRNLSVMGEAGSDWVSHVEVCFDDVRVFEGNLFGDERCGFVLAQECFGLGRIYYCMCWLGICVCAMHLMTRCVVERSVAPFR